MEILIDEAGTFALKGASENSWCVVAAYASPETEKKKYKSIIKAIRLRDSKNLETSVVGSAAIWSLKSNTFQHPEVYAICQTALKQTKGGLQKHLKQIITNVNEKKR